LDELHGYRGIAFAVQAFGVQPIGPHKWKWVIYPKIESGMSTQNGVVTGTRADAEAACKKAIDQLLVS
jgi:hypothetical protein